MPSYNYPPLGSNSLSFEREARGHRTPPIPGITTPEWDACVLRIQRREKAKAQKHEACKYSPCCFHSPNADNLPDLSQTLEKRKFLALDTWSTKIWSQLHTEQPDWFPDPHATWLAVYEHCYHIFLQDNKQEEAIRTFVCPFEVLLGGAETGLQTRRSILASLRGLFQERRALALVDSAVCPMSKKEWRDITSGAWFRRSWPSDAEYAYAPAHIGLYGDVHIFGQAKTAAAQQAAIQNSLGPIPYCLLDCGCDPVETDWVLDETLKVSLPIYLAEQQLFEQLALLSPALNFLTHESTYPTTQFSAHRHKDKYPLSWTNTTAHPEAKEEYQRVFNIVWFRGRDKPRGWEREDFHERRAWVACLSEYLVPLWRSDKQAQDWELFKLKASQISTATIDTTSTPDQLKKYEGALLLYFMRALERDHNLLPVPFFPTTPRSRGKLICDPCWTKMTTT